MDHPELLLISPPDYETREFRGAQPLGIAYLAAALRQAGIPAELLDANVGGPMPFEQFAAQVERFVAAVRQRDGRPVVGISVVSQVIATAAGLAARIKAVDPDVLVIVGGYHPTFADFRNAIEQTISEIPTTHASDLASLMTLNFQQFENVSLMAA